MPKEKRKNREGEKEKLTFGWFYSEYFMGRSTISEVSLLTPFD